MEQINDLIDQSFNTIGLILVFVFVLFDVKHPKIRDLLAKFPPPPERPQEFAGYLAELRASLFFDALPLVIVNGALLYLFLPLSVNTLAVYRFSAWNFDFIQTAFLFVIVFLASLFLWACWLFAKIIIHLRKARGTI